jgi:hypothetical protein
MKVQNHTTAIEKALHLDEGSVKHEGNFLFSGKLNGCKVMICTEPVDEMQNEISIYSMEIGEVEQEEAKPATAENPVIVITSDTRGYDGWVSGEIKTVNATYNFDAKVFNEKSQFGIYNGRVSKLCVFSGKTYFANYDRGWDIRPTAEFKPIYKALMKKLNGLPKV